MIVSILAFGWLWTLNTLSELFLYKLLDIVTTQHLRASRDQTERQLIWLYEASALLICSSIVWFHHFPYFLLAMLSSTLLYTQFPISDAFRHLWHTVKGRWEEFEQHSECLEQTNHQASVKPHQVLPSAAIPFKNVQATDSVTMPISCSGGAPIVTTAGVSTTASQSHHSASSVPQRTVTPVSDSSCQSAGSANCVTSNVKTTTQLPAAVQRLPGPYTSDPIYTSSLGTETQREQSGKWAQTVGIMRRAIAALAPVNSGNSSCTAVTPQGMLNYSGQNLCFINAVLLALSKLSSFADELVSKRSPTMPMLVNHLAELFVSLNTAGPLPGSGGVDTTAFRQAASSRSCGLIVSPQHSQYQSQQDAAEFLTWLLSELHSCLNGVVQPTVLTSLPLNESQAGYVQSNGHALTNQSLHQFARAARAKVRLKYNNPSALQVENLRSSALRLIEAADGLDGASYIGPLLALADADRLQHAAVNNSIIDDLFTGQLIDVRLCEACQRIAATTQLFHILLVPIARPHDESGIVKLEDCLGLFGIVEELTGQNGLHCEHCNRARLTAAVRSVSNLQLTALSPPSSHRTLAMSPIALLDRSTHSSDFIIDHRTSTPIPGAPRPPASVYVTNCKRRSLLGYAPPCLVIQLMRFGVDDTGSPQKLKTPVSIPMLTPALTQLLLENIALDQNGQAVNQARYELFALCLHAGGECTANGHYVSYAQCSNGLWYQFDDARVCEVNMDYELTTRVVRENAYLLFYRLVL